MLGVGHQHGDVRLGARHDLVEVAVRGGDRRGLGEPVAAKPLGPAQQHEVTLDGRSLVARHQGEDRAALAALQLEHEPRRALVERLRGRLKAYAGLAHDVVEPVIAQHRTVREQRPDDLATARAPMAADLEQIGEVGAEINLEDDALRTVSVGAYGQALVAGAVPQELGAVDVDQVLGQDEAVAGVEIGIGHVGAEQHVVVADRRAEQQRPLAVDAHLELRQIAGIAVIESGSQPLDLGNVAVGVEDREGVAVLERARAFLERRARGRDVELIAVVSRPAGRLRHGYPAVIGRAISGVSSRGTMVGVKRGLRLW